VRHLASVVSALCAFLWAASVLAATVVIVRPANSSPAMSETVVRIHGELMSSGFDVEIVDGASLAGADKVQQRDALERLAEQRGADAVVGIVGDASPNSVEVWVVDKVTGKSVIRRLPFEPQSERAPQTLAIRAIELLRSSFLEIHLAPGERRDEKAPEPSPTVVRFAALDEAKPRPERLGIEVGAAAVIGFDGVGTAVLPVVRFDWALTPRFLAEVALGGLGTQATVATQLGSAQVAQEYALAGACYRWRVGSMVQPYLSLTLGALHSSVEGRANSPNQSLSDERWSGLADGGLGTWIGLRNRFHLALAAHVQMAEPYVGVRFLGSVVATSARPNVLLTLTVGAWL
jgi:hypothetical protein